MAIGDDISVADNGDIRRTGDAHGGASPGYYTVIEFHRWLQELADDASAQGDDVLDITDLTPSDRSTDNIITMLNGYNIDDDLAEYLYDGSIIQAGGDEIYDGIVNFGNASFIDVVQNGLYLTNDFWNTYTPSGFNADAGAGISHRFLVKVRDVGADIDGRRLLGITHEFNKTYSEFSINGSARGNNVLALGDADDLNNETAAGTVATWTSIVNNNEGYTGIDVVAVGATSYYYSNWDLGSQSKNDFYERMKWLNRRGSTETVYGLDQSLTPFRGITHEIVIDTPTGTFVEPEQVTWGTGATAGVGQLLAIDSVTAGTKMWIQLLSGVAPTDGLVITGTSTATATVNVTVTPRDLNIPFVGASTGSAIIGGYGLGIEAADLSNQDKMTDLDGTLREPPNNVTFTVSGLVSAEDYVVVGPRTATAINKAQLSLSGPISGANETTISVQEAIPSDTPSTGTIRVVNDSGYEKRITYTGISGSDFTGCAGDNDFSTTGQTDGAANGNDVWVSYIDSIAPGTLSDGTPRQLSFTVVYNTDRDLFVRVRDGGGTAKGDTPIKTFEGNASTLTNTGGSIAAIRTTDL